MIKIPGYLFLALGMSTAFANQQADEYYQLPLEQLMQVETQAKARVGSLGGKRNALDAEVPIDVITAAELESSGHSSLTRALAALVPGFNAPAPSIADGTDHAAPFTLRGLNPDQVLVLVNGKRLHQSSLLHNNGTVGRGSSSVDLNIIPLAAISRVEILRDSASAQYGSDAIAGTINIILKGYGQPSQARMHYGQTGQGDGQNKLASLFHSIPLRGDGFINLTGAWRDRGRTNRAGRDMADGGRINTRFGDADSRDGSFLLNAELLRGDTTFYSHALYNRRHSRAGAYFRHADDDGNITELYPSGFLPKIAPKISDYSLTGGAKGIFNDGTDWDLSYTHGHNDFHFYVKNSLNASLGPTSPTAFDAGSTHYTQQALNLALSKKIGLHTLSYGYEVRQEHYRIRAGDRASYEQGTHGGINSPGGAQGFPGFSPDNEVSERRQTHSVYGDLNYRLSQRWTLDTAARLAHHNDFGSAFGGKLALRFRPIDNLLLRTSLNTGFRAPSLTQSHFSYTGSYRNTANSAPTLWGNFAVDHPVSRALGAKKLKVEKSTHLSMGLVFQPTPNLTASLDGFVTDIHDRIMPTTYISADSAPAAKPVLDQYNIDGAVYFANALKTRTHGVDLRLDYNLDLKQDATLKLLSGYQYSKTRIKNVRQPAGMLGQDGNNIMLDTFNRVLVKQGQPADRINLHSKYSTRAYDLVFNLNRYGKYASTLDSNKVVFAAKWTLDAELAYHFGQALTLALGGLNLLDTMPDKWEDSGYPMSAADKVVPYSQYSPFGFNGRYYYMRAAYKF
ncbi:TonB-dependent receptor plug domain-containing protein [Thiopseudomonas denitrificans]|uniref:Iron complex outermembrane receptor protein n=1 Tax=Thiopseudomonas denitrificans TaxID=1501432 RepID=A0A4R6TZC5_9GAMM|nr:TonB-dependent receptor [Thiopseudomonas denitrificans]TDQ38232.1 iron complex outermembrane receptor protein [Thiopseudomonas denitrificans]